MAKKYIHVNYLSTRNKKLRPGCWLIKYQTFPLHMQHENRTVSHLGGKSVQWVEAAGGWGTSERKGGYGKRGEM